MDWNRILRRFRRPLAVALLTVLLAAPALADPPGAAGPRSLDEAVAQVESAHPGRVLSARGERRNGGVVYLIRLLTADQQVRNFEIPGGEGARP
jgi:uncharacterized membrane protein YkoI